MNSLVYLYDKKDDTLIQQIKTALQNKHVIFIECNENIPSYKDIVRYDLIILDFWCMKCYEKFFNLVIKTGSRLPVPCLELRSENYDFAFDRKFKYLNHTYLLKPVNPDVLLSLINFSLNTFRGSLAGSGDMDTSGYGRLISEVGLYNYQRIIESLEEGVGVVDKDENLFFVNHAAEQILGYSKKELCNMNIRDITSEDSFKDVMKYTRLRSKGVSNRYELNLIRKDGSERICTVIASPLMGFDNTYEGAFALFFDITDMRKNERELRFNEERFRSLFSDIDSVAVQGYNSEREVQFWNRASEELYGYTAEEVIGRRLEDLIIPDSMKAGVIAGIKQWYDKGIAIPNGELCLKNKASEPVYVYSSHVMIENLDGEKEMFCLDVDLSQKKIAEKALLRSEEKLRSIFRVVPAGIGVVKNRIIYEVNPKFCEMTGYKKKELIGRSARILYFTDEEYNAAGKEKYRQIELHGTGSVETRMKRKDGSEIFIYLASTPIDKNDLNKGVTFTALDISPRIRIEQERVKLESQLRHSQKLESVGTLAGGIAHDFNNILTPIMGYAEMTLAGLQKEDAAYDNVKEIFAGARRAKELVQQILTFSRYHTANESVPVKVHEIIKEALVFLRSSIPTTIDIKTDIDEFCKPVQADPTQIHQIIVNLCTNSYHAMPHGGTLLLGLNQIRKDNKDYARITVEDTGVGIDRDHLHRIFEPFFTTKPVNEGTGLGLSVIHGIVRNHNGDIKVQSIPDQGTVFEIFLPVTDKFNKISDKSKVVLERGEENIFVVDDETVITVMLKKMLSRLGYTVFTESNSTKALEFFRENQNKIDLVISDFTMPFMTGLELTEKIREFNISVPVIIMTGFQDNIDQETMDLFRINSILSKPIERRFLADAVRKVFDTSKKVC